MKKNIQNIDLSENESFVSNSAKGFQVLDDNDDTRSEYEISMRNKEWNMLSDNQRKKIETLHDSLVKCKRNFEALQRGEMMEQRNEFFMEFLETLEKEELKSIAPEILMTTKFGQILMRIVETLKEVKHLIPRDVTHHPNFNSSTPR